MNSKAYIQLKHIRLSLGGKIVFPDLSWELLPAQHWAVIGPNAQGKSSFLRLLAGELHPDQQPDGSPAGLRLWNFDFSTQTRQQNNLELASYALSARAQTSLLSPALQARYQTLELNLSGLEVVESGFGDQLMLYQAVTPAQAERTRYLAAELGAEDLLKRPLSVLSQGQLRLLLLLRALVKGPRLLLLDEPGDGLDQQAFAALAKGVEIAISEGTSVILATHNQDELLPGLTHFLELQHGRIVSSGPLFELHQGKAAQNVHNAVVANSAIVTSTLPTCETLSAKSAIPPALAIPLVSLHNVDVFVEGEQLLHALNWEWKLGENWLISGPNGAGKSSFIRLLRGELFPTLGGEQCWPALEAEPGARPHLSDIQRKLALVSDRLQAEYDYDLSGLELILSGLEGSIGLYREFSAAEKAAAQRRAEQLHLEAYLEQPISRLSSGTLRRFFLARALIANPLALLLDEPCSGLDQSSRAVFMETLAEVLESGQQALYISHRPKELTPRLRALFKRAMKFKQGHMLIEA